MGGRWSPASGLLHQPAARPISISCDCLQPRGYVQRDTGRPRVHGSAALLPAGLVLSIVRRGAALFGWGMYRLGVRAVRRQFELILGERGRIARELHGTLV